MVYDRKTLTEMISAKIVLDREKIASQKNIDSIKKDLNNIDSMELIKQASEALTTAAHDLATSKDLCLKLAHENEQLVLEKQALEQKIEFRQREDTVNDLIQEMLSKQMLTKHAAEDKRSDLINMSKEAFETFSDVVHNISKSDVKKVGVNNLQYLITNDTIISEPETMKDAILSQF